MNSANAKWFQILAPAAPASSSAGFSTTAFDTAGFDYLEVVINQGVAGSGATLPTVQLCEGDSSSSASTAITGTITGTSTVADGAAGAGSNLLSTATNGTLTLFNIDLKGRKRWMSLTMTPSTSTVYADAVARLSRAELTPTTHSGFGVNQVFQVPQPTT